MSGTDTHFVHDLDAPWPAFLDLLDEDPRRALEGFHVFAWKLSESRPPAILRSLDSADQQDRIAELVLSCSRDEFRKLRRYQNVGKPFAAWLTTVLDRQVRDWLRRQRPVDDLTENLNAWDAASSPELPNRVIECLNRCMDRMSPKCRLYLVCFADGMKPKEIALLLKLPEGDNKRVSDDLRHCIRRLRDLLTEAGVRPEEVTL